MKIFILSIIPACAIHQSCLIPGDLEQRSVSLLQLNLQVFRFVVCVHVAFILILVHAWVVLRMARILLDAGAVVG